MGRLIVAINRLTRAVLVVAEVLNWSMQKQTGDWEDYMSARRTIEALAAEVAGAD